MNEGLYVKIRYNKFSCAGKEVLLKCDIKMHLWKTIDLFSFITVRISMLYTELQWRLHEKLNMMICLCFLLMCFKGIFAINTTLVDFWFLFSKAIPKIKNLKGFLWIHFAIGYIRILKGFFWNSWFTGFKYP